MQPERSRSGSPDDSISRAHPPVTSGLSASGPSSIHPRSAEASFTSVPSVPHLVNPNMTAMRGSTGPALGGTSTARRFQPYLSSINTDSRSWQGQAHGAVASGGYSQPPSFDSPISAAETASTASLMTPTSYTTVGQTSAASYESPQGAGGGTQYPYFTTTSGPAYAQGYTMVTDYAAQPRSLPSGSYGSAVSFADAPGGAYESVPIGSRRHTVSGFAVSPGGTVQSMMPGDMEDSTVKEEKRRRNKESSQRFRDRTRERQREKQERLEYLERRVKDLEDQLKDARVAGGATSGSGSSTSLNSTAAVGGAPVARMLLIGENETALGALQRLQQENDGLRAALKTAEQEIIRTRSSLTAKAPFNTSQVYQSLPQLSPGDQSSSRAHSDSPSPTPDSASFFASSLHSSSHPATPLTGGPVSATSTSGLTRMHADFTFGDEASRTQGFGQNLSAPPSVVGEKAPAAPWDESKQEQQPVSTGPMGQHSWMEDAASE